MKPISFPSSRYPPKVWVTPGRPMSRFGRNTDWSLTVVRCGSATSRIGSEGLTCCKRDKQNANSKSSVSKSYYAQGWDMKTELKGSSQSGFKVTEKDIRRIIDLIVDKVKAKPDDIITTNITYKLANGAIITTDAVDDLFAEENAGTRRLVDLRIEIHSSSGTSADIRFTDLVVERDEKQSIFYKLQGEHRDPIFVLASELDERIAHTKQIALWPPRGSDVLVISAGMLAVFTLMVTMLVLVLTVPSGAKDIINSYNDGKFSTDVAGLFQFIVQLEQARQPRSGPGWMPGLPVFVLSIGIILMLGWWFMAKNYFVPFNFVWGEQIGVVEKRERQRRGILFGVGLAMIVGIISSYVAGLLPRLW